MSDAGSRLLRLDEFVDLCNQAGHESERVDVATKAAHVQTAHTTCEVDEYGTLTNFRVRAGHGGDASLADVAAIATQLDRLWVEAGIRVSTQLAEQVLDRLSNV